MIGQEDHPGIQNFHHLELVADEVSSIFQEGIRKKPEAHSRGLLSSSKVELCHVVGAIVQGVRHRGDYLLECSEKWECVWQLVV